MKRLTGYLPILTLIMGVIGLFLRKWQLRSCFDEAGLPLSGPAFFALTTFTVAVILCFALAIRSLRAPADWVGALNAQPMPVLYLPAAGTALSGLLFLRDYQQSMRDTTAFAYASVFLPVMMVVGCLFLTVGLILLARGGKPEPAAVILSGFGGCFWLVNAYHSHANNPVVPGFAWFLMAAASCAAAWYYLAGFAMDRGHFRRGLWFCLTALFLCLTSLAGGESASDQVMLAAQACAMLVFSFRLTGGKR